MSKQADAKAAQGYQDKPERKICLTCQCFETTRVLPDWEQRRNRENSASGLAPHYSIQIHGVETKPRCGLGYFAVKKTATCDQFRPKVG